MALTLVHPSGNLSLYRKVVRNNWIFECSKFQVRIILGRDLKLSVLSMLFWLITSLTRETENEDHGRTEFMERSECKVRENLVGA